MGQIDLLRRIHWEHQFCDISVKNAQSDLIMRKYLTTPNWEIFLQNNSPVIFSKVLISLNSGKDWRIVPDWWGLRDMTTKSNTRS